MARKRKGRSAAFMRSINPFLKAKSKRRASTRGAVSMARRKGFRRTRGGKGGMSPSQLVISGVAYGALRTPVQNLVKTLPVVGSVGVSDELLMMAVSYFASTKGGMIGRIGKAGLLIEASRLGSSVNIAGLTNMFGGGSSSTGSASGATF